MSDEHGYINKPALHYAVSPLITLLYLLEINEQDFIVKILEAIFVRSCLPADLLNYSDRLLTLALPSGRDEAQMTSHF